MASSGIDRSGKIIVDSIHGDIKLSPRLVRVINTASFQRLRQLKQLAMSHLVYPNATHTRFAHSIGTLGIMNRVLRVAGDILNNTDPEQEENLKLAALLHDIGHYPYSHLMEKIDKVQLTEKWLEGETLEASQAGYPDHEELGTLIVTTQADLRDAIGGPDCAKKVGELFTQTETTGPQISKLVHSSLDLDRLDYLLRDSHAAGVPYGHIDINYLLNCLRISPSGMVGFLEKALPAVEHVLLARFFMYRVVYYHKTTYGFEETCRQLLRRLRDRDGEHYGIPADGQEVKELVETPKLHTFTDAFVDDIIRKAAEDHDKVIKGLARSIQTRTPPKLLKEIPIYVQEDSDYSEYHGGAMFLRSCRDNLVKLAEEFAIDIEHFLICEVPSCRVGEQQKTLSHEHAVQQNPDDLKESALREEEKTIRLFTGDEDEPKSLMTIRHSVVPKFARYPFKAVRLYVIYEGKDKESVIGRLSERVKDWDKP